MRQVILAERLIDGSGRPPLDDPMVVLEGGQISTIQGRDNAKNVLATADVVHEYKGATLLPGLIDGHVHLAFSAAETTEEVLREYMESDDLRLAAMATENARRCLSGGITTIRDCGGPGTMIQALRNAIAAGVTAGPTIIASGMPITTTAGHCHFFGVRVDNEAEARKAVRQLVQDDADWIKVMATGGRMTKNSNIYRAQYTLNELQAIVDEADRLQRRVAAHVLSVEGIRLSVEAGVHTLEHCNWQDGNGQPDYDEDLVTLIKDKGIHVSVTIVGYMRELYRAYLRDPTTSPLPPALKARFQIEGDMFARGLNTFITSDAGVPQSHFAELHLSLAVAVTWLGLDPMTAVEAVTSRAACALGIDDRVGTLEVGKIADILVVHGDPLDEITTVGNVSAVFRGGRIVNVGGAVFSPDIREIGTLPYNSDRIHGWKPRL